jgi:hypothetical protein
MCKVGGNGRFADAAFEILDSDNGRLIEGRAGRRRAKDIAHMKELFDRVARPASQIGSRRLGEATVLLGHADAVGRTAEERGGFGDSITHIETFAGIGKEGLAAKPLNHADARIRQFCYSRCI